MTAMKQGNRDIESISDAVELDKKETQRVVALCMREGLITNILRFTPKGERFFRRCRAADLINIAGSALDNSFYFPHCPE